ncbi:hypothetical protein [Alkanindiges illinoisensis]|uniref:hypothetical protein n=1 Tax=Alkanindiges illinoisensis TaxID=197183 RepID=UPI00047ACD6F|nr:hypothetical protein [Alkanindiges illinoisensis]
MWVAIITGIFSVITTLIALKHPKKTSRERLREELDHAKNFNHYLLQDQKNEESLPIEVKHKAAQYYAENEYTSFYEVKYFWGTSNIKRIIRIKHAYFFLFDVFYHKDGSIQQIIYRRDIARLLLLGLALGYPLLLFLAIDDFNNFNLIIEKIDQFKTQYKYVDLFNFVMWRSIMLFIGFGCLVGFINIWGINTEIKKFCQLSSTIKLKTFWLDKQLHFKKRYVIILITVGLIWGSLKTL